MSGIYRREWKDMFKTLKMKSLQPSILYPARLSFRTGERKNFSDKQNLKDDGNTKSILKEILKSLL